MQIDDRISAFLEGKLALPELEADIDTWIGSGGAAGVVLEALQRAYDSGRLPVQVYQALTARVGPQGPEAADDATRLATPRDEKTRMAAESAQPADEKTRLATEYAQPADEKTRLRPAAHPKTEIVNPPTEVIHPPTEIIRPEAGAVESQSTAPSASVDFDVGTQSNWDHPEQWTARGSGPIGPGSVIRDRFQLEEELGAGGMGVVYKARDLRKDEAQDSDPWVAIKVLTDEFRDHPQALVSLQREAVKAQKLAHPNIITVYDFDRDGTTIYLTMELMRGKSFADVVKQIGYAGMDAKAAAPLIQEMAAGLAYAHEREIVHSDFKPGNLFLTDDGRVKILDFGIARAATGAEDKDDWFDAGSLGALTPGYASLEMIRGDDPHPADDVYALAIVAYLLLTGEHPFGRQKADKALIENLKPAPIKGLKAYQWRAIRDGLAFRREDRIQDAGTFLRRFRGHSPVRKWLYASTAASLAAAAFFAWQSTLDDPGPFPEEQRAVFDLAMSNGETLYTAGLDTGNVQDVWAATEFFAAAYDIHPRNPRAVNGLERSADAALDLMPEDGLSVTLQNLVCRGHLAEYRPVVRACKDAGAGYCESLVESDCS